MKPANSASRVYAAIICAAGSSSRMGGKVRKPYLTLRGRPILAWTLAALARIPELKQIVLVTKAEDRAMALSIARKARLPRRIKIDAADGGARRQDSVFNGLKATRADAALVLIHDAARPFPEKTSLVEVCRQATQTGAAILACRVRDTIKKERARSEITQKPRMARASKSSALIASTVPRARLWQAQTPQVFRRGLILECFEKLARTAPDKEMTDDASLCEYFQHPVALVESSSTNFKVTQPEDLEIAEAFLKLGLVR